MVGDDDDILVHETQALLFLFFIDGEISVVGQVGHTLTHYNASDLAPAQTFSQCISKRVLRAETTFLEICY